MSFTLQENCIVVNNAAFKKSRITVFLCCSPRRKRTICLKTNVLTRSKEIRPSCLRVKILHDLALSVVGSTECITSDTDYYIFLINLFNPVPIVVSFDVNYPIININR